MKDIVIASTARTPLAKSWKGAFNMTHGATLRAHVVQHALHRTGIEASEEEDIILGCVNPEGATGSNIARQIALAAGCPASVAGMTVNRFCASGLQAIALAAQRIVAGKGEIYVAGGVESISCVQREMNRHMALDPALERKPSPKTIGRCCKLRSRWQSSMAFPASGWTSTAHVVSSGPAQPRRTVSSTTKSPLST